MFKVSGSNISLKALVLEPGTSNIGYQEPQTKKLGLESPVLRLTLAYSCESDRIGAGLRWRPFGGLYLVLWHQTTNSQQFSYLLEARHGLAACQLWLKALIEPPQGPGIELPRCNMKSRPGDRPARSSNVGPYHPQLLRFLQHAQQPINTSKKRPSGLLPLFILLFELLDPLVFRHGSGSAWSRRGIRILYSAQCALMNIHACMRMHTHSNPFLLLL